MRVLHVNSGNLFGGVETLLLTLARERAWGAPMRPEFALCFRGRLSQELEGAGKNVTLLGEVRVRRPWSVWAARRRFRQLLQEQSFDVVVCHAAWVQAIFGPVARTAGVPLVFWLHDPPGPALHWLERWAMMTPPDLAICNSRYTLERLPRLYSSVRGELLYCPVGAPPTVSEAERAATRKEFGASPGTSVIVQAGRWAQHKGHLIHLEALGRLRGAPDWLCWQVGAAQTSEEERYLQEVTDAAERFGVADRVRFLGWQPDLPRILASADVYCQPNTLPEPFGIVFVEALYAGLPVVTAALGGAVEIVDNGWGFAVPPSDAIALAEVLADLITAPQRRHPFRDAGPARATALCAPGQQLPTLAALLSSVTHSRPSVAERVSAPTAG